MPLYDFISWAILIVLNGVQSKRPQTSSNKMKTSPSVWQKRRTSPNKTFPLLIKVFQHTGCVNATRKNIVCTSSFSLYQKCDISCVARWHFGQVLHRKPVSIIMFESRRYRPVLTNAISVIWYWWLRWIRWKQVISQCHICYSAVLDYDITVNIHICINSVWH